MSTHTVTQTTPLPDHATPELAVNDSSASAAKAGLFPPAYSTSCAIEYFQGKDGGFAITERVVLHSSKRRYRK